MIDPAGMAHHPESKGGQGDAVSDFDLCCLTCLLQRNIKLPGGCHKGELTKVGQQQAREVGDWLRGRYIHQLNFLPNQYKVPLPCQLLMFLLLLYAFA